MDALNTKIKNIKTEKALKVRPENIKKDVSIFGITGTFEGNSDYAKFVEQDRSDNNLICYIYKPTLQEGALEDIEDIFENDNNIIATLLDIVESDFSSIESTLQSADVDVLQDIINLCDITYELFLYREGEYYDVARLHIESSSSESADIFNSTADYGIYGVGFSIETDAGTGQSTVVVGEPYEFIDTSDADATATDILNGKTAYVGGQYIQGTLVPLSPSGTISITQNGTVDVTNYASASVNVSSGGSVEPKDVNLYDFDGTLLASYTKAAFLLLESLPENPTHTGLVARGWNYSLADAKTYLSTHNKLDIGQMYNTVDNKTRIHISLPEGRTAPYCGFGLNGTVTVDWGDNTTPTQVTGSALNTTIFTQHEYAQPGDYIIEISNGTTIRIAGSSNGTNLISKNSATNKENDVYRGVITRVDLGNVVLGTYAFDHCYNLKEVVISQYLDTISSYSFQNASGLKILVLPDTVTTMNSLVFQSCYSLEKVVFSSAFRSLGDSAFSNCQSLRVLTIPNALTTLQASVFQNCYALQEVGLTNNVISIANYAFSYCYSLRETQVPAANRIYNYCFQYCYSLSALYFPKEVLNINTSAFSDCRGLSIMDFSTHEAIPTITSSSFTGLPADCKIIVPDSLYESWIAASYWSNLSSRIVKASEA